MIERNRMRDAVHRAIEQVNQLSASGAALGTEESDTLLGEGSRLDSMGFINFIVAVEEEFTHLASQPLDLVEIINAAQAHGQSITTVGQLIDLLCDLTQA